MGTSKKKAQKVLDKLKESILIPPLTKDGHLDVEAYNCLSETKSAIEQLKACGYMSSDSLLEDGFVVAALTLRFKNEVQGGIKMWRF